MDNGSRKQQRLRLARRGLLLFFGAALVALLVAAVVARSENTPTGPAPRLASTSTNSLTSAISPTTRSTYMPPSESVTTTVSLATTTDQATEHSLATTTSVDRGQGRLTGRVLEVVDGDTLVVAVKGVGNEKVRLIGIDAPERDERFYTESKRELARLVSGKTVGLETDVEERDRYGRLLAYVWLGDVLVNAELVRSGVVTLYTIPPNVRYVELLEAAQEEAQAAGRGMWGAPGDSPVKIITVNYDAPGNDNYNLNEEYVVFEVVVAGTLVGYSVEDESGKHYQFPDFMFQKGDIFKLHSGSGTDTHTDLYWGASGSAIWNNGGDTVKVLDPEGRIVESYTYQATR
ncbi:MAG: thermonuclease family protein [Thermoleophilia bacterium]|nr:thermonuclease family protein [Thermoleophilia bacterium]